MIGRMLRRIAVTVAALALATGASADPVKIRIGYAVVPANFAPLVGVRPGLTTHLDKTYTLDRIHFTGTPQQMEGFAAGEVDLASFSFATFAIAILNAKMDDIRIVADIEQDGAHGSYSNEFMVLKDGPVKSIADLKGKIFGTVGAGSSGDVAMRVMLRKHGIDDTKAITYIDVAFPNMKAMLLSHKIDVITAVTPFSMDPELRAAAVTLFTQADAIGPAQLLMMVAHQKFIAENRPAMVDFFEDLLRTVRWFTNPANHDEAVAILANVAKRPPEVFAAWAFTKTGDQYRDPDGLPDIAGVQASIERQRDFGGPQGDITVAKFADLSMMQEAAKRLDGH